MTAYAFFVQTSREDAKRTNPGESVVFADFSRKCAERWKSTTEQEKLRFKEMADNDKKRYEMEMDDYVPPPGEKRKRRRQPKDPNAPKRSLSAFFWFCNDERSKVKGLNPEYGVGEVARELGRLWSETDPEVKKKYEGMAQRDKDRYGKEMAVYKA